MTRQRLALVCTAAFLTAAVSGNGAAQDAYPNQQIRIIVPFPAGGGTDITARLLGEQLRRALGHPIVVDNRTGASGMIGTLAAAKSPPDGYTLLVASGEMAVNPHLYKQMAYDWDKDLVPITLLVKVPNILVVNADVPVKSVQELIAYAKANPRKLTFSTSGVGNPQQLAGELLNKMAGLEIMHVPYKGAAPQLADVARKHITMTFSSIAAALPFIESGKVKPIAVTSSARVSMMPNVPAVAEYPPLAGYELVNFFGFLGPAGLPDPVLRKLNASAVQALQSPDIATKLKAMGFEPAPMSSERFRAFIRRESEKFAKIIIDADVKVEQ
ncbi:MAG TPA: tripartite tricarboxylate transporter substrate binding protein [Burkholderiales bacterium]|jgi:tripartite-type tricarboxylate transporter receptor subunit TctC|nr:tripartite tricarboxylate transporter substrate binding protein [Burkholderiales bacterium]